VTSKGEHRVTDGVHAAVHPMQAAGRDPVRDRLLCDSQRGELPCGDDAVLPRRERRYPTPNRERGEFHRTVRWKPPRARV
jgi:hypothetical protein